MRPQSQVSIIHRPYSVGDEWPRLKIAQLPDAPSPIRTLPGYGYLAPAA